MTYLSTVLADNPSFLWLLNESSGTVVNDSTANAVPGTYTGGVTLSQPGPVGIGNAAKFDGSTGFAFLNTGIASVAVFSVEFWFQSAANLVGMAGFSGAQGASASNDRAAYLNAAGAAGDYIFNSVAGQNTVSASGGYNNSRWHHFVSTVSNTTGFNVYVDAVETAGTNLTPSASYTGFWLVGCTGGTSTNGGPTLTRFFNGSLSAFAFYSGVALTPTQVTNHFNAAPQPPPVTSTSWSVPLFTGRT